MNHYSISIPRCAADEFKCWLHAANIQFEPSECGDDVHFEITATPAQKSYIEEVLANA